MRLVPFERLLPPAPGVGAAVRGLWCMTEPHASGPEAQVVPPDDRVELVFHSGEGEVEGSRGREPLPQVFLGGLRTSPVRVVSRGPTHMLSAWLHPWAAPAVLGCGRPVLGIVREVGPELRALAAELLGWLMAVYGLCAFLAAPALGRLSDVVGRRPVLLVSMAGSAVGDLVLAGARSVRIACLGRVVDGVTAGNMGAVHAYVTDTVAAEERARVFGRLGALFGLGLIAGPALGSALAAVGDARTPLWAAAALAVATTALGLIALPESAPAGARRERAVERGSISGLRAALRPRARRLLGVAVLATSAAVTVQLLILLVAKDRLGWSAARVGAMVVAVGITDVVVQGLLIGPLRARMREETLGALGLGLVALAGTVLAGVALWPGAALAVTATFAVAAGEGLFTASFAACLSRAGAEGTQGALQGAHQGLTELTAVVAPVLATQLYARGGGAPPLLVAAALAVVAAIAVRALPAGPGR